VYLMRHRSRRQSHGIALLSARPGDGKSLPHLFGGICRNPHMRSYEAWVFCGALGEMRGAFGLHIALIAVRNGLDIEGELASILPADPEGDDNDTNERTFRPR